jgi:hypothetical protein
MKTVCNVIKISTNKLKLNPIKFNVYTHKFFTEENRDRNFLKTKEKSKEENQNQSKGEKIIEKNNKSTDDKRKENTNEKNNDTKGSFISNSKNAISHAFANLRDAPALFKFLSTEKSESLNQPVEKLVMADHNFLRSIFQEFESATSNEEKEKWRNMLVYEIARHFIAEEIIVYPLVRNNLANGEEHYHSFLKQHHEFKQKLVEIHNISPDSINFMEKVNEVWGILKLIIEKEEKEILPELIKLVKEDQRIKSGNQYTRRKFIVPTRPHTIIPEHPPSLNSILGLLTSPIDKFRDIFTSYPDLDDVNELKKKASEDSKNK